MFRLNKKTIKVRDTQVREDDTRDAYREKIARITLDAMVQFVGLLDAQGTVLEINHVALNAVGIELSDVEGKPFWTTFWWQVSEEINQTLRDAIRRAAQGEFVRWDAEIYGRAGGKETIIIDASLMPVRDETGEVVFIAAEGRDITEKKAQEREIARQREELAQLDLLKTQFFANISHEFRTPLTLMLGPLEDVMSLGAKVPAEALSSLQVAHRNSLRLLRLVNTLLDFSRIEAGRVRASFEPVDLATLTAELASTFRSAMEKAGLRLAVACPPLAEPVYVDREMWEKIVLNLLSNAFKYTFHGTVEVQVAQVENAAVLTVRDTGIGIAENELPHLFERFHRVEGARGRTLEGSGIGLALVAELAKLHGGTVDVESRLGQGSKFTVRIPLGRAHIPADRIGAPTGLSSTAIRAESFVEEALRWLPVDLPARSSDLLAGKRDAESDGASMAARAINGRVLVADDNADMLGYVCGLLGARYEVSAVSNGAEALRAAQQRPPDLVLADVMMPEMDGFELLQALRENPRTKAIPVILLSARAGEESRSEGMEAGADDYLVKPFSARELLARVGAHLKLAQSRRQADEAILTSEERLRFAIDAEVGVGTWDWDVQKDLVYVSRRFAGLFSVDPERAAAGASLRTFVDAIHPEDRERVNLKIQEAMQTGEDYVADYRVVQKDGSIRWLNARGRCHIDENGVPRRFPGLVFDITERMETEVALARQAEELKRSNEDLDQLAHELRVALDTARANEELALSAMESNTDCVKVLDLEGRLLSMNQNGCRLMEVDDFTTVSNRWWPELWQEPEREKAMTAVQAAREGKQMRFNGACKTAKGKDKYWDVTVSPIMDAGGEPRRILSVARDITIRRLEEAQFRETAKLESLGVLAGGIAHDFNNLLTGILGNASLLETAENPADRALADEIVKAAERAAILTRQMLAYSGRGRFLVERMSLSTAIVEILRLIQTTLDKKVELVLNLDRTLPPIEADPGQMQQLIMNLIINASEAMQGQAGQVVISTTTIDVDSEFIAQTFRSDEPSLTPGRYVKLEVHDTGSGMSEETLARIWDPFYTTKFTGRGLGLAAVSGILRGHRGAVRVYSHEGQGTTFKIFLPVADPVAPKTKAADDPGPASVHRPGWGTILLADDEETVRRVAQTALQRSGYEVLLAKDGKEVLDLFARYRGKIRLIILDLTMPVMSGEEAIFKLRQVDPHIPILLSSGYNQVEIIRRFTKQKITGFVQKPFTVAQLHEAVARALPHD